MGNRVSICDVNEVLLRIKTAVATGRYQFIGRRKNLQSIATAGLLPEHVKQLILGLTFKSYLNGPEDDIDNNFVSGEVFLFGLALSGDEYYVKLKLFTRDDEESCTCISFHIAEKPLYYPYH